MQYHELGQEIERILPGNVISQWQYDVRGRPTNHRISSQNRHTYRRVYQWDVNHRLKGMVNELTDGRTTYGYDEFSNLVWSNQGNQFDFSHRNVGDVGNLYETKDKKDCVYNGKIKSESECGHLVGGLIWILKMVESIVIFMAILVVSQNG